MSKDHEDIDDRFSKIVGNFSGKLGHREWPPGSYRTPPHYSKDRKPIPVGTTVWYWNWNINKPMSGVVAIPPDNVVAFRMNADLTTEVHLETKGPKWHDITEVWVDEALVRPS